MKIKVLLLMLAFLVHLRALNAQVTVKGQIKESHVALPIGNATISLSTGQSTISDENGFFMFRNLPNGLYKVFASSIGYEVWEGDFSTDQPHWNIVLERDNQLMRPIEIRAVRAGEKAPFAKSTISSAEIEKRNLGQDIPFVLNQTPSVVINSDAGNGIGYSGIRIRGTDATRINITLNGIPYNDAESQGSFFVDLPDFISSVNTIQVQRGVGTSSNGAGAFGATINMATNELNEKPYAELNNSFGSFNTWKNTVKAGTGLINNHFTLDTRLSRIVSDGYIDRASSDLKSFYLSGAYLSSNSSLRLNIFSGKEKTYQAWYGVPENLLKTNRTFNPAGMEKPGEPYDNETDNYQQNHYQLFFNHRFNENWSFNTALFYTRGNGYYEQYKAEESFGDYGLADPVIENDTLHNTDLVRQLWLDNYFYGNIFSLQFRQNKTELIVGGGWNRYDGNHFGKIIWAQVGILKDYQWYDLDALKTDFNLYTKWQQESDNHLGVFADIQYRRVNYDLNGFRDNPSLAVHNSWNFFNPKVGITYSQNEWFAYLSYAMANKEPNRDDFEAGQDQQPKHETLHDVELGVEKRDYQFGWGATAYYMRYRNQLVLTGKVNDVGAYTRTNIPDSYRMGLELQARWRPTDRVNISGNFTLSENKLLDFIEYIDDYDNGGQKTATYRKTDISFSPALTGGATISFIPVNGLELSLLSKYVSRQFLDNTANKSRSLNAFYTQDAMGIYTFNNTLFREINLILRVNNIFNTLYEPNGYTFSYLYSGELITENYYYPMAGTNFMLGLNVKF